MCIVILFQSDKLIQIFDFNFFSTKQFYIFSAKLLQQFKKNVMKELLTLLDYQYWFGKKNKSKEPVISQEEQKNNQFEKQIHNLNTLIGDLDDKLDKVDAKVLKLDEDIKALVSQKKIQQAKAKIQEMKTYQKQIEGDENKKGVLTQMKIQMESMSIDSKLVGALKDGTELMQKEDIASKLEDVMIDVYVLNQQQSQTNDLFSQMAYQNVDQSELDDELAKYVTQADTLQAQQAQEQFNQVPVLSVQQNKPQVQCNNNSLNWWHSQNENYGFKILKKYHKIYTKLWKTNTTRFVKLYVSFVYYGFKQKTGFIFYESIITQCITYLQNNNG
ncbi:hypothetical protein pb186bvf_003768 [Paramecium bursaria]